MQQAKRYGVGVLAAYLFLFGVLAAPDQSLVWGGLLALVLWRLTKAYPTPKQPLPQREVPILYLTALDEDPDAPEEWIEGE